MRERPNPDDREPLAPPYCSDPNCAYCKELREIGEELRRKNQAEVQGERKRATPANEEHTEGRRTA